MPITDRDSLHRHLQWALQLEHATIPAYLCALYSIPDGTNTETAALIRGVVMEEMLHLTLAANVLNAVGGEPALDHPQFIPTYPGYLPHSADTFQVQLLPLSPAAIEIFLAIERPARPHAPPEPERYHTIGQFYEALQQGIERLAGELGEKVLFNGKPERQVPSTRYYGGGGEVIAVTDLDSARRALEEVKEQGEGIDHTIFDGDAQLGDPEELAHYFRFLEIREGRRFRHEDTPKGGPTGAELPLDWSVISPMRPNPKVADYQHDPSIHRLMVKFNRTYTGLLRQLHTAFNGEPGRLFESVPKMYELKYQAQALMNIPSGLGDGTTVGPSFEYDDGTAPIAAEGN
jgi:hypothetical protein